MRGQLRALVAVDKDHGEACLFRSIVEPDPHRLEQSTEWSRVDSKAPHVDRTCRQATDSLSWIEALGPPPRGLEVRDDLLLLAQISFLLELRDHVIDFGRRNLSFERIADIVGRTVCSDPGHDPLVEPAPQERLRAAGKHKCSFAGDNLHAQVRLESRALQHQLAGSSRVSAEFSNEEGWSRGLFPDLGHPLDFMAITFSSSNRSAEPTNSTAAAPTAAATAPTTTTAAPRIAISDAHRQQLFFGKVDRLGRQCQVEDLVRALHLGTFAHAHADVAGRFVALFKQDGFGIGQQPVAERVVGPGPGDDPAPLFVLNPLLFGHDAPLSSTQLKRVDRPRPLRGR